MIPQAAIDAAMRAARDADGYVEDDPDAARAVLEAAAPLLAADPAVATTWLVNPDARDPFDWITVELTCFAGEGPHKPSTDTWAVRWRGRCLNLEGEWEFEPLPSSRDAEFYARCRYVFPDALRRAREVSRSLALEGTA